MAYSSITELCNIMAHTSKNEFCNMAHPFINQCHTIAYHSKIIYGDTTLHHWLTWKCHKAAFIDRQIWQIWHLFINGLIIVWDSLLDSGQMYPTLTWYPIGSCQLPSRSRSIWFLNCFKSLFLLWNYCICIEGEFH